MTAIESRADVLTSSAALAFAAGEGRAPVTLFSNERPRR
jgi:hypothetical protein